MSVEKVTIKLSGMKSTLELLDALRELREAVADRKLTDLDEIEATLDLILRRWAEVTA